MRTKIKTVKIPVKKLNSLRYVTDMDREAHIFFKIRRQIRDEILDLIINNPQGDVLRLDITATWEGDDDARTTEP